MTNHRPTGVRGIDKVKIEPPPRPSPKGRERLSRARRPRPFGVKHYLRIRDVMAAPTTVPIAAPIIVSGRGAATTTGCTGGIGAGP